MSVTSYIDQDRLPYPFCPGCSHGPVLDRIDEAMVRLGLETPKRSLSSPTSDVWGFPTSGSRHMRFTDFTEEAWYMGKV